MFSKSFNLLALAVLFVTVHQTQAQANTTSTPAPTTEVTTTTSEPTTAGPTTTAAPTNSCQPLSNCFRSDPPICGRLPTAICRRFRNICDLQSSNCAAQNNPLNTWTIVSMVSCRGLAVGGTGQCSSGAVEPVEPVEPIEPTPECPTTPTVCPTGGERVCAISRNGQQCRKLLNACALRNLNCQTEPRNNWVATNSFRCRNMCPGNAPERCTSNRFRILLTVDDEENPAA